MNVATLRTATTDDVEAMLRLMDVVHEWVVSRGGVDQWGPTPFSGITGFAGLLTGWVAHGGFTVAERDGDLVGVLAMADAPPDEVPAEPLPDGAVFVHFVMSHRGVAGRGVGRLMMSEADRRARRRNAPGIALGHWSGGTALAALYDRYGYRVVGHYDDVRAGTTVPTTLRLRNVE